MQMLRHWRSSSQHRVAIECSRGSVHLWRQVKGRGSGGHVQDTARLQRVGARPAGDTASVSFAGEIAGRVLCVRLASEQFLANGLRNDPPPLSNVTSGGLRPPLQHRALRLLQRFLQPSPERLVRAGERFQCEAVEVLAVRLQDHVLFALHRAEVDADFLHAFDERRIRRVIGGDEVAGVAFDSDAVVHACELKSFVVADVEERVCGIRVDGCFRGD